MHLSMIGGQIDYRNCKRWFEEYARSLTIRGSEDTRLNLNSR